MTRLDLEEVNTLPDFPPRPRDGHKGTFGTTLVIGGATRPRRMLGGPCLAARAALRSGGGLAVLAVPESLATAALMLLPEATALPLPIDVECPVSAVELVEDAAIGAHAVVCGPGLGRPEGIDRMVMMVADLEDRPRVLDADALNSIAAMPPRSFRGPLILTPHPGEWNRLARCVGIAEDAMADERRPEAAAALARRLDAGGGPVVVVLKGDRTVVSDGRRFWRSEIPNSAMATGGTGDVLAGTLGGLLAQFHPRAGAAARPHALDAFEIACLGVAMHAEAGRVWSDDRGDAGMLAHELADALPMARRRMNEHL
ncbi:MAG: NAD(P)H-hydrate dehydratase [Planctomycetota bacterium]|nr:NAD(P)H-hydrate dehydratase [Planctomycetota bacterium]MDA1025579.1 NAD(P)H-hydrate dehydratase [Planctomycetota bacterium]